MHGVLSLGPSGPFARNSQPAWFFHGDGAVRVLDMSGYQSALVEAGIDRAASRDLVARMRANGTSRILWARGEGGRRGHLHAAWDVRVATTATPAIDAVGEITGSTHRPLGAAPVSSLEGHQGVLTAYTQRVQPQKVRLPSSAGPTWSRTLRLPSEIRYHYTCAAYAALAVGPVGATVTVMADSVPGAEHRLRSLTEVVLDDIAPACCEEHEKP